MAIVNNPPILLADEPTGNLDSETAEDIMGLLKSLNEEGKTVIMVTHNPDMCRYAGRTLHVKDGLVAFDGTVGPELMVPLRAAL
jgi:putative ABC transport system ATP-binding protein